VRGEPTVTNKIGNREVGGKGRKQEEVGGYQCFRRFPSNKRKTRGEIKKKKKRRWVIGFFLKNYSK